MTFRPAQLARRYSVTAGVAVLVALLEAFPALLRWKLHLHFTASLTPVEAMVDRIQLVVLGLCAAAVALVVARRHPLPRPAYLAWLRTTPWQAPLPLPLGPVRPDASDLINLTVLAFLSVVLLASHVTAPMVCFAVPFTVLAIAPVMKSDRWLGVLLLIGLGALVRLQNVPWVVDIGSLALYAVAQWGHGAVAPRLPVGHG